MKKNLANKLTLSRFLFGILMLVSVFFKSQLFFIIFYMIALLTDILDGFFARKHHTVSEFGKKLDIYADNFVLVCVILGLYYLKKQILLNSAIYFIGIFSYYLIVQLISLVKTKKLIFMRTYVANFTAIAFPFLVFFLVFFQSKTAIIIYSVLMIFSLTEKIFLQIYNKKLTIFNLKNFKKILMFFIIFLISSGFFVLYQPNQKLCFDDKCIEIEIMDTPEKRALGLMYRQRLSEEQGMLFIFDEPREVSFWMKNVQFSIDMIFVNENNTIIHIEKSVPPCYKEPCQKYPSQNKVKYVIEVISGFSDKYNLTNGQSIEII